MKFSKKKISIGETEIHLLQFDDFAPEDYLQHLTEQEIERFSTFNHLKRKREFIATRLLRHNIFGFKHIHYNSVGAPYIEGQGFISISHAPNLVGIALNNNYQIGLDLELIQEKALRLHSKFVNEDELEVFNIEDQTEMTQCWSAKETLYKLAGRKKIDFKKELLLSKSGNGDWEGKILNPSEILSVQIHQFTFENYVVSINAGKIVKTMH